MPMWAGIHRKWNWGDMWRDVRRDIKRDISIARVSFVEPGGWCMLWTGYSNIMKNLQK